MVRVLGFLLVFWWVEEEFGSVVVVDAGLSVPRKREVPPVEVWWWGPFDVAVVVDGGGPAVVVNESVDAGPQARVISLTLVLPSSTQSRSAWWAWAT
jgi:hypothetical protein